MRFRMLGPVLVRTGGGWTAVAAEQQRLVLAVLMADAGRAVSTERLVDVVWGDQPPTRATNTVQVFVMRLRRLLGDGVLVTRDRGYELAADAGDIDATVFERLVTAGRQALGEGRSQIGAAQLAKALALWHGPVFADVPASPYLAGRAAHLDQMRLAVEEDHLAALLDLDQQAHAADALERLVDEHPLRERRWALLMRALHGCGRRADALDAFQRARRDLRDQLGIEPGAELHELQHAILTEDPAATPVTADQPVSRPAQLPADVLGFTGRHDQLEHLDALLPGEEGAAATAVVISAIAGTPGVGKTGLAVHWAHLVADQFPHGQLYVNLRGFDPLGATAMRPADAVRGFLDALGVAPERIPIDLDSQEGAHPLLLEPLTTTEARELLAGRLDPGRVQTAPAAVAEIVTGCSGLPLALCVAAARAVTRPHLWLSVLADEMRDARDALDALGGADPSTDVRAVFACSYRALGKPAARLFRLLALHPGPDVSTAAAASLAATSMARIRPLLAELTEASRRLYTYRDPVELAAPQRGVLPELFADDEPAVAWFHAELQVLFTIVDHATAAGFDAHVCQLA